MADAYKDFSQIPRPERQPARPELDRPAPVRPYHEKRERVVGGTIKWKAVDAVAARVVAPAPWWGRAPQPQAQFMKIPDSINLEDKGRLSVKVVRNEKGEREELLDRHEVEPLAVDSQEKHAKRALENLQNLEARARDIHDSLDYLFQHIGPLFVTVNEGITKELLCLREKRFGVDTETRLLMNQLKEVRQFFLDENHDRQVDRLREFVDLCERLKALKEDGFLDTIADTILKL